MPSFYYRIHTAPNISLGTVYRNLSLLSDIGEIQKLSTGIGPDRFDGTTLGVVSAVSTTLPRPKGSALRLPSGRLGTSAATRRPRAPQAYSSLGRALHHRQDFEAQDIQVGQRSRRGLQQRLEHPTATSLLPLKCFKSFVYLAFFTCINKV